ncbi:hypothetical protein [Streptomyces sp. Ac-502]|uniref:hypothetical protein n=1 Tax=Streptomyces sp. Ac-502 TaxID=3342801 RepID=UPI003862C92B
MPDQPAPRPAEPRVDETAGDIASLVRLGVVDPPPAPSPPEQPRPPQPDPRPAENAALIDAALADIGVERTAADEQAVTALARLDTGTVDTVTRWIKHKKKDR